VMMRAVLWPTVFTVLGLAVLVGLGTWQLKRLAWKGQIISLIETRTKAEPISLEEALARWHDDGDVEYLRVRARGKFLHDNERHLFAVHKSHSGWFVFAPLALDDGKLVLVNRGFVPNRFKNLTTRKAGLIETPVEIIGLVRKAPTHKGWFVPANNPSSNEWYWRDLSNMAASIVDKTDVGTMPFFVASEASDVPGGWPVGGVTRVDLPNRHFEYALTWYGLALGLVGVYAFFVRARLRAV